MSEFQQLLDEQARAYICDELGHTLHFVLPLQVRHETRQVLAICATCHEKSWAVLSQEGFTRFLKDASEEKIK